MSEIIKVGIIGCGRIGNVHIENLNLNKNVKINCIFDSNIKIAKKTAKRHQIKAFENVNDVFNSKEIDAIIIASSTNTHSKYIEKSILHKKPVFCEKPIDLSFKKVRSIYKKFSKVRIPVQIGFNRRFDPCNQKAKLSLEKGKIGELHKIIITSRDPEIPPKSYCEVSGGIFRDMTIHDFDLARFFLEEEPVEVFALANRLIEPKLMADINDFDTCMIILRTANGKQCFINNSRKSVYGYDQRVELFGSKGMLISENQKIDELRQYNNKNTEISSNYKYFFLERYNVSFQNELNSFIHSIKNKTKPKVSLFDGKQAMILAEAAYLSLKKKRLVKVSEIND